MISRFPLQEIQEAIVAKLDAALSVTVYDGEALPGASMPFVVVADADGRMESDVVDKESSSIRHVTQIEAWSDKVKMDEVNSLLDSIATALDPDQEPAIALSGNWCLVDHGLEDYMTLRRPRPDSQELHRVGRIRWWWQVDDET